MKKFIYVFSEKDRDELINAGYTLLKGDDNNSTYIFLNKECMNFSFGNMRNVQIDTLSF